LLELLTFSITDTTYNCRVNKSCPATILFEKCQDERHSSRTEEDDNQLILELFKNQLPKRSRRIFCDCYRTVSLFSIWRGAKGNKRYCSPFRPYFPRYAWTCDSVRPWVSDTEKNFRTSEIDCACAFSMLTWGRCPSFLVPCLRPNCLCWTVHVWQNASTTMSQEYEHRVKKTRKDTVCEKRRKVVVEAKVLGKLPPLT
jgi:hypothetical protein